MSEPKELPRQKRGVVVSRTGSRIALQDAAGQTLCELNATAEALWELCDGATSADEMIDAICEIHDAPREVVAEDVLRTLGALEEAGALG